MAGGLDHFCPGCGAVQAHVPRYPWYFCGRCLEIAEDRGGRRLAFANAGLSGGLIYRFAAEAEAAAEWQDACAVLCLIRGRRVLVQDARFGGVVAQPVTDWPVQGWSDPDMRVSLLDLS